MLESVWPFSLVYESKIYPKLAETVRDLCPEIEQEFRDIKMNLINPLGAGQIKTVLPKINNLAPSTAHRILEILVKNHLKKSSLPYKCLVRFDTNYEYALYIFSPVCPGNTFT